MLRLLRYFMTISYLNVKVILFGSLYPTWFGQEMTFVISKIRYKRVRYIEVLLYFLTPRYHIIVNKHSE